jgi:hypothetical protein
LELLRYPCIPTACNSSDPTLGKPIAETAQGSQGVTVDIGADDVLPVLADGSRGPSLLEEPLIRLYAWVQMDGRVADEVNYEMTADQARELASSLSRAGDQLDAINGRKA